MSSPSETFLARFQNERTRRAMAGSLRAIAYEAWPHLARLRAVFAAELLDLDRMAWHELDRPRVVALVAALRVAGGPSTFNARATALRGVLRECWRAGLVTAEQLAHTLDAIPNAKHVRIPRAPIQDDVAGETLAAARRDRTPLGRRDHALLALLFGCGLRRAELAGLTLEQLELDTGRLAFAGKGGKWRVVFLPADTRAALDRWLEVRGREPGPLFCGLRKGGKPTGAPLSDKAVWRVIDERSGGRLAPHDARRWNVSTVRELADLETAQRQAGHARIEQTAQYDTRWEKRLQHVAGRLELPSCAKI